MAEINIKISDELSEEIKEFNLDVSRIVAKSIREELVKLMALKAIAGKSKLSMEDALVLGKKIKKGRFEELKKKGLV